MEGFKYIKKQDIENLPKTSGVYSFYGKELLYIGKAINIKNRVKNHFSQPSYRDGLFVNKVTKIGYLETGSEIEALIIESKLIKKYQPKFNVVWKDDKNYFYVAISKNEKTIVYITHQKRPKTFGHPDAEYIGPFVEGTALKKTLRFLRRVFPYYTQTRHPKTKCTYCHLDLCPGPNPDLKKYKKNINRLILVLKGKRSAVLSALRKEMKALAKEKKFEEAGKTRDIINNLQQVMAHTGVIEPVQIKDNSWIKTQKVLQGLLNINKPISRIECYDVSNMQGENATGSMAVFIDGVSDKNYYRKFHIKIEGKPNDIAMLEETIKRRLGHKDWTYPEIMLIDGGIAQLNIAIKTKNAFGLGAKHIKVISLAKRNKDLYIEGLNGHSNSPIPLKTLPREIYNLILQLDDEAHRFAINYHKKLRKKQLLR